MKEEKEVMLDFSQVYPKGMENKEDIQAWEEEGKTGESTDKIGCKRRFGSKGRK